MKTKAKFGHFHARVRNMHEKELISPGTDPISLFKLWRFRIHGIFKKPEMRKFQITAFSYFWHSSITNFKNKPNSSVFASPLIKCLPGRQNSPDGLYFVKQDVLAIRSHTVFNMPAFRNRYKLKSKRFQPAEHTKR